MKQTNCRLFLELKKHDVFLRFFDNVCYSFKNISEEQFANVCEYLQKFEWKMTLQQRVITSGVSKRGGGAGGISYTPPIV